MNKTIPYFFFLFTIIFIFACSPELQSDSNQNEVIKNIITQNDTIRNVIVINDTVRNEVIQNDVTQKDIVHISFTQPIEGYEVNVLWTPKTEYQTITGPAIISFKGNDTDFSVSTNHFGLRPNPVKLKVEDGIVVEVLQNKIELEYKAPTLTDGFLSNIKAPFLFTDLNFDNKKELLITKPYQGQRGVDAFDVFSFSHGDLASDMYQITKDAPYAQLDELVKIDRAAKELIVFGSGGMCYNTSETYSLIRDKLSLTKIVKEDRNDEAGTCTKYTYSVKDGIKKLISKEEM